MTYGAISAVAFADFNGDGYPDAAGPTYIAFNQGGGGYVIDESQSIYNGLTSANYASIDAADIDNDGDVDIANGNSIWLNDGFGNFSDSGINLSVPNLTSYYDRDFADLNNDGFMDLVVVSSTNSCYVLINDKNGGFVWTGEMMNETKKSLATGDFNGDGHVDIITDCLNIFLNNGNGLFGDPVYTAPPDVGNIRDTDVEVGDFNNDGYLDFITTGWKPEGINAIPSPTVFLRVIQN